MNADSDLLGAATAPGIEIRTSTDRTAWTYVGKVWPNGASWTNTYTGTNNGNLWAPDCYYTGSEFLVGSPRTGRPHSTKIESLSYTTLHPALDLRRYINSIPWSVQIEH